MHVQLRHVVVAHLIKHVAVDLNTCTNPTLANKFIASSLAVALFIFLTVIRPSITFSNADLCGNKL